jgi:hypothetical protein
MDQYCLVPDMLVGLPVRQAVGPRSAHQLATQQPHAARPVYKLCAICRRPQIQGALLVVQPTERVSQTLKEPVTSDVAVKTAAVHSSLAEDHSLQPSCICRTKLPPEVH